MEASDHTKIQAPGHDGVHVCSKCGWPFPNSHPSARHRRAHKKVCGTLEGYKLVDSNVSDDERVSDEDNKKPSPRVLERSINEKGSSASGEGLLDDVFTDAAAEFSESSGFGSGVEESFMDARKSASNLDRVAKDDSSSEQSVNGSATAGIIQSPSSSTDSYQMKNHEVSHCTTVQLESALQYQDDRLTVGPMVNSVSGYAEESYIVVNNDSNSLTSDSYRTKSVKSADEISHVSETNAGETEGESSLEVVRQDNNSRGDQEVKSDSISISQDMMTTDRTNEMTEVEAKLEDMNEQDAMSADGVFQSKEESTENPKMSTSDLYSELGSVIQLDASFVTAQINVDADQTTDSNGYSHNIVEGCDGKDGNESAHVLSLPKDINVSTHSEVMLEGFKDHRGVKLHELVPLDSSERIEDKEDTLKNPVRDENSSSFQSRQLSEVSAVASSVLPVLKEKSDDGVSKSVVKEVPFEGQVILPEVMATVDENKQSDEVGVPAYAAIAEMKKKPITEEGPCDVSNDSLKMSFPDVATEVVSDMNLLDSSIDAKVNEPTMEKGRNENRSIAGTEYSGVIEDNIENTVEAHKSSNNSSRLQVNSVNSMIDSSKGDNVGDQEHFKSEKCDIFEKGSSGGPIEENFSIKTKSVPEFASDLHESQVAAEDATDGSNDKTPDIGYTHFGEVSESSRPGSGASNIQEGTDDRINGTNTVLVECVDGVSMPSESYHDKDVEISQKSSEYYFVKEPLVSPQDSAAVEENDLSKIGGGTSIIEASETVQAEDDSNSAKQNVAAADISIDSCSRTDSLEAHWGSVSVLSTQSDVPTVIDVESYPSTDSLAPAGAAESTNLKKLEVETKRQGADESGVFEPPSFLTPVENGQKVDGSETQAERSVSASQQAGLFPTLSNVVNESPGRKKNEELIAKVTNWSSGGTGKQHIALKSLISEESKPKSPSAKENPKAGAGEGDDSAVAAKGGNGGQATTVNSILGSESPAVEMTGKEWNSPARYPSDGKREKSRKVKGRPLWAQFVCCSSVN